MSYLVPLGPFDQALRGPQRIVLRAEDERIINIEHHHGYHARGCAARLRRLPLFQSYPLVNRVCGVHSHHHALAWTLALEHIAGIDVPPRAQTLRTLVAEAERMASHVYDAARIFAQLGLQPIFRRLVTMRELALDASRILTGRRLVQDFVRPGGVQVDLNSHERVELEDVLGRIADELEQIGPALLRHRSLRSRTVGLAVLGAELLRALGVAGWLARASGIDQDLRRDQPYAAYTGADLQVVAQPDGDVYARLIQLLIEAYESTGLCRMLLATLPEGRWRGDLITALPPGEATISVEAPSGVLRYKVVSDGVSLTDVEIQSAQAPTRMLLRAALAGKNVDDAPLVLTSLAMCTACAEA